MVGANQRQWDNATLARAAAALLLALLGHLVLMASPLHAASAHHRAPGPAHGAMTANHGHSDHGAVAAMASPASRLADPADCAIEAVAPSRAGLDLRPALLLVAGWLGGLVDGAAIPLPLARAIGPPPRGDPQAILQVFRN